MPARRPEEVRALTVSLPVVVIIAICVVGLWLLTPFAMEWLVGPSWTEKGQAGDQYGSINALFSGLAFAGVIIAILLQREELALQRKELRESVAAQDKAQHALTHTLWAQNFKVVLDIIEAPDVVAVRGYLYEHREYFMAPREEWSQVMIDASGKATRSFEGAGTIVRNGLLPLEYLKPWTLPVSRCWEILGSDLLRLREQRKDPFLGADFEWLANQLKKFKPAE
jgi:hypothetical protein